MRNRRLLTLAVLAVALGFAPFAQAETGIVTVVESGTNYDIRLSISGGVAIGSAASTPGILDFVVKSVYGLEGATVDTMAIQAPEGSVTGSSGTYAAGFNTTTGIRNVTFDSNSTTWNAVLLQPAAYDDPCTAPNGAGAWTPEQDAGVLIGVGTTGGLATDQPNPPYYPTVNWEGGDGTGPAYDGDTLLFSGTFTAGTGTNHVGLATYGPDSISVLPADANGRYTGPLYDDLYDVCPPVDAVVIQHSSAPNGGGTVAPTVATTLKVEYGDVVLGADYASSTFVTLQVTDGNTSITLGASKDVGGLDLQAGNAGYQIVDVDASRLNIYGGDQATIEGLVDPNGIDGLFSSQVDLPNEVLVVGDMGTHIAVLATINGDATLDGTVDDGDFFVLINNWKQAADFVTGDWNGDDLCDDGDFFVLINNWKQTFVPTGAAVPEPATLSLLGLGVIGILSRRRRK